METTVATVARVDSEREGVIGLFRITPICSARSPCLAMLNAMRKLLITLIGYYSELPRSVVRGPRASQC